MKWHNLQDVLREMVNKKGEIKIETPDGDIYTLKEIDGVFKPANKLSDVGEEGDVLDLETLKWRRKIKDEEINTAFNSMLGIDRGCENIEFVDLDGSLYKYDKDKIVFFLKETQAKKASKIESFEEDGKTKIKVDDEVYIFNEKKCCFELDVEPVIDNMLNMKTTINETPDWKESPPLLPLTKEKKDTLLNAINTSICHTEKVIISLNKYKKEDLDLDENNIEKLKIISNYFLKDLESIKKEIEDIKL